MEKPNASTEAQVLLEKTWQAIIRMIAIIGPHDIRTTNKEKVEQK